MTAALKACVCSVPRPRTNPGHERTCVVCGWRIPPEWGSQNIGPIYDRLVAGFPAGPPPSAQTIINKCLAREQDGRRHFGFRFHGRNNFRDGLEEAADWLNYRAFEIILARKAGDEAKADRKLVVMMKILEAVEADLLAEGDD